NKTAGEAVIWTLTSRTRSHSSASTHVAYLTMRLPSRMSILFCGDPARAAISTLSLHDALPIYGAKHPLDLVRIKRPRRSRTPDRSEEHTSELQSRFDLVCRLLLEKKNTIPTIGTP